jgi:hypothetical protein
MRYKMVRLHPIAKRIDWRGVELPQIDGLWRILASREELELCSRDASPDQTVQLGTDCVREYLTDGGRSDGILILKCQIVLFMSRGYRIDPLVWRRSTGGADVGSGEDFGAPAC